MKVRRSEVRGEGRCWRWVGEDGVEVEGEGEVQRKERELVEVKRRKGKKRG